MGAACQTLGGDSEGSPLQAALPLPPPPPRPLPLRPDRLALSLGRQWAQALQNHPRVTLGEGVFHRYFWCWALPRRGLSRCIGLEGHSVSRSGLRIPLISRQTRTSISCGTQGEVPRQQASVSCQWEGRTLCLPLPLTGQVWVLRIPHSRKCLSQHVGDPVVQGGGSLVGDGTLTCPQWWDSRAFQQGDKGVRGQPIGICLARP